MGVPPSPLIVRVQSPDHGTKRVEAKQNETVADFLNKLQAEFGLGDTGWNVYKSRDKKDWIRTSRARTLDSYKIRHGDMLYLFLASKTTKNQDFGNIGQNIEVSPGSSQMSLGMSSPIPGRGGVIEDEVDQILDKEDGKIYRKRNEQLCHHGPQGKCLHCVPLMPYDEEFLHSCDPPIKFLSFHSHLRKLTGGVDKGKFAFLENISCKIKTGCTEHPPWPGGICTKCQPNAVTLNRQKYRHVDYIMYENASIVDRFLNFWRTTGNQRIGIMYGKYEPHKDTPLGIKATVCAIYEPPQVSSKSRVELLEDPKEDLVNKVADRLGIGPVGWIFTDLIADDLGKGTVKHFRGNINSHFLSAEECIMAADFQNKHTNPCKLATEGHFGSKFVTVVVTGDASNQIHFEGYQVSNQCMALVRDDCLIPTKDAPELGYVKESSDKQYVPDVFYKIKDSYGNEITQLARPLPVEYLLVDLPAAFPLTAQYTFKSHLHTEIKPFSASNRDQLGEAQDFNALVSYLQQFPPNRFLEAMSDFHILVFLGTSDMLPVQEKIGMLLDAVKIDDEKLASDFKKTEEWATVEEMMAAHEPSPGLSRERSYVGPGASPLPPIGASPGTSWTCAHCTFINSSDKSACDMCSLPK
ncbi:nuclear protein localization protein 4 homolog isoform X1 [Pecten maximus]|uniref:nuclear protein localization protein 4 homolog isoform X1 n=1 Tax=Pecten maximus TaxID=6579 RepID=UPI00145836B5|nr:nuclear protein localization protein 4 homolog isoform X1 [Pecten maximus]